MTRNVKVVWTLTMVLLLARGSMASSKAADSGPTAISVALARIPLGSGETPSRARPVLERQHSADVLQPPMVGTDTCPGLTIPGLPYQDSGDTCGLTDDYFESCPHLDPGSPDVVYNYTPTRDELVTITLCSGPTDYDTKLFVYEAVCPDPGNPLACNDDGCRSPAYPLPYVSLLIDVGMTAGTT